MQLMQFADYEMDIVTSYPKAPVHSKELHDWPFDGQLISKVDGHESVSIAECEVRLAVLAVRPSVAVQQTSTKTKRAA